MWIHMVYTNTQQRPASQSAFAVYKNIMTLSYNKKLYQSI